jgi:hypothetical protein
MKPVLAWIKSNILIVISMVVIVVPVPVAYYFSNQWNAGIREGQQEKVDKAQRTIRSASTITYGLPAIDEAEGELTETRAPNAQVTAWYAERLADRRAAVENVLGLAEAVNRAADRPVLGNHRPVVEGLFPAPDSQAERIDKVREFFEVVTGRRAGDTIYDRMISAVGGSGPPDDQMLAIQLSSQEETLLARYEDDPRPMDEVEAEIQSQLASRRLGAYAAHAGQAGVFMTPEIFHAPQQTPGIEAVGATPVALGLDDERARRVRQQNGNPVTPAECFVWQWDLWIYADVLAAIDAANRIGSTGEPGVRGAVVKRVESIAVSQFPLPGMEAAATTRASGGNVGLFAPGNTEQIGGGDLGGGRDDRSSRGRDTDPGSSSGPADNIATHTGRKLSANDADLIADIRRVSLVAVVASDRLPLLLDEIGRSNLMTVVDMDLTEVDVIGDLRQGYDYGPDHVVRASILIESKWLRSWTASLMPEAVREVLGVPAPQTEDEFESD